MVKTVRTLQKLFLMLTLVLGLSVTALAQDITSTADPSNVAGEYCQPFEGDYPMLEQVAAQATRKATEKATTAGSSSTVVANTSIWQEEAGTFTVYTAVEVPFAEGQQVHLTIQYFWGSNAATSYTTNKVVNVAGGEVHELYYYMPANVYVEKGRTVVTVSDGTSDPVTVESTVRTDLLPVISVIESRHSIGAEFVQFVMSDQAGFVFGDMEGNMLDMTRVESGEFGCAQFYSDQNTVKPEFATATYTFVGHNAGEGTPSDGIVWVKQYFTNWEMLLNWPGVLVTSPFGGAIFVEQDGKVIGVLLIKLPVFIRCLDFTGMSNCPR